MAKMFSGVIKRSMRQVEAADEEFLSEVLSSGQAGEESPDNVT